MKEKNKLVISIIAVALIIVLVGGGTYAYWIWNSANNTSITFTVAGGTMTIDGGGDINTTAKLAPSACTNTTYAIQRKIKVTATNDTTTDMVETIQLKINNLSTSSGSLTSTNKASIEWALVRSDETQHAASTWLEASSNCASLATTETDETTLNTTGTMLARGTFSDVTTGGAITLYNSDTVLANGSSTDYYELYIWINPGYTGTATEGTTVKDALQDLTINLVWQGTMSNQPTT